MEYRDQRFKTPRQGEQVHSEYDIPSDEIQDLNSRDVGPLVVTTIPLDSAGSMWLNTPGRAFVPYFFVENDTIKTRVKNGVCTVYVNQEDASNPSLGYPCKHNRGFRGSFSQVFITWPAQSNVSMDFVILKSEYTPWMTDG